jgi:glycosyltransferase involved in cell wall biosynthesis
MERRLKTEDNGGETADDETSQMPSNHATTHSSNLSIGANGILVPPRDAAALADAIEWLVLHPAERSRMGLASRDLAEQEFSIETVVEQTLVLYI